VGNLLTVLEGMPFVVAGDLSSLARNSPTEPGRIIDHYDQLVVSGFKSKRGELWKGGQFTGHPWTMEKAKKQEMGMGTNSPCLPPFQSSSIPISCLFAFSMVQRCPVNFPPFQSSPLLLLKPLTTSWS
jgi:hypothetical protein